MELRKPSEQVKFGHAVVLVREGNNYAAYKVFVGYTCEIAT